MRNNPWRTPRAWATASLALLATACGSGEPHQDVTEQESPDDTGVLSAGLGTAGLLAEYYSGENFTQRVLTRIDSSVNYNWGLNAPATGLPSDGFSVRWTGRVLVQYSETYTFQTTSDDGVRLWVNGQLIIDDWTSHVATQRQGSITLKANESYDIKLEYFDRSNTASVYLGWFSPSQPSQSIPASRLSHPVDFTRGVYQGGRAQDIDAYQSWFGPRPLEVVGDYTDDSTWSSLEAGHVLSIWKAWVAQAPQSRMVHVAVVPWPRTIVGSLADCAAGLYDENYKRMGTNYKSAGMGRTIYRFAWEEHGKWFPWTVKSEIATDKWADDPVKIANFKQCFRHFSQSIKSTNPQALVAWDAEIGDDAWNDKVYPGDDVVDRVSRDQYDGSWIDYTYPFDPKPSETTCDEACKDARRKLVWDTYLGPGLVKVANFATRHNKPFDLGEWGVIWRADGHGGLDNPYFIEGIYKLMTGRLSGMLPGFQPGYASYFEALADKNAAGQYTTDTRLRSTGTFITAYPRASAKYRELFGH